MSNPACRPSTKNCSGRSPQQPSLATTKKPCALPITAHSDWVYRYSPKAGSARNPSSKVQKTVPCLLMDWSSPIPAFPSAARSGLDMGANSHPTESGNSSTSRRSGRAANCESPHALLHRLTPGAQRHTLTVDFRGACDAFRQRDVSHERFALTPDTEGDIPFRMRV